MSDIKSYLLTLSNMILRETSNAYTKLLSIESKKQFMDMYELDVNAIYKKLIINNEDLEIYVKGLSEIDETLIKQKLDYIHSEYDKGKKNSMSDLYIGYYFIDGYIAKGKYIRGPLFMFHCEINKNRKENKKEVEYILKISTDESIFNTMLLMEICRINNIEFNEEFISNIQCIQKGKEKELIEKVFDMIGARYYIEEENTKEEFKRFNNYSKETIPNIDEFGGENKFRVLKTMVLGIFTKNKSSIYNDYVKLIKQLDTSTLENMGLLKNIFSAEYDEEAYDKTFIEEEYKNIKEYNKYFLSQLDVSQEEAVLSTNYKNIVVIEGPPGTGKSEVIASIISNNVIQNKSILMVCEKEAALKVIIDKYKNIGLEKYILNISDSKNLNVKSSKIKEDIREILNLPLNEVENKINEINNKIQENLNELEEIHNQLYNKEYGMSLHELYSYKIEDVETVDFKIDFVGSKFTVSNLKDIKECIKTIANNVAQLKGICLIDNINEKVDLNSIDIDINEIIQDYEKLNCSNGLSLVDGIYRNYSKKLNVLADIYKYRKYLDNKQTLLNKGKLNLFQVFTLNFFKIFKLKNVANKLKLDSNRLDDIGFIQDELEKRKEYMDSYETLVSKIESLNKLFTEEYVSELKRNIFNNKKFSSKLKDIKDLIDKEDNLYTIKEHKLTLNEHQQQVINILINKKIGLYNNIEDLGEYWYKVIEKSLVQSWIKFLEGRFNKIKTVSSNTGTYECICKMLNEILYEKEKLMPQYIESKIINSIQNIEIESKKSLENYLKKQNKKISMKKFISETIKYDILKYKPIWFVTPEVAASILPLKQGLFDIIIFDESSQMTLEDAIPCMYRGKKIVVAGDTNQLPPPKFNLCDLEYEEFDNVEINEGKEELSNSESLLHYIKNKYYKSKVFLNYHYRSKYKELINFSNYAFYDGNINIIPNADYNNENKPIDYIYLEEGRIDDGTNILEARKVVDVLKDTMKKYDNDSIAIIAFTKNQQKAIEKEIENKKENDGEFKHYYLLNENREELDKKILISNIDEIQGEQRDIVIFSVGYAPREKDSKVDNSITGNLNKKDGKYRLNVAISRAKNKIILITSIKSSMFPPIANEESEGRKLLKRYLDYCEAVYLNQKQNANEILKSVCSNQNVIESTYSNKDESPLETEIRECLQKNGVMLNQQVEQLGFRIDFAVIDPRDSSRYLLAIECDGATYHSSRTAKERDLYRQRLLEGKGWDFIRIWSRDWWKNKDKQIERVLNRIEELTNKK